MPASLNRRRFTVHEYECMGTAGIFSEDDRVELLNGEVILMPPIGELHAGEVDQVSTILRRLLGDRAIVRVQNPVILGLHWEPQPDICLLRPRTDFYKERAPHAEDVLLAIEVADTTLETDRNVKVPRYGKEEIPESWVLDVNERVLWAFRDPYEGGYRTVLRLTADDALAPVSFPEVGINVADLF